MKEFFYDKLLKILSKEQIFKDEPMKNHTTFRIGGPADWFVTPSTKEEIQKLIRLGYEEGISVILVGNGSNLLVGDLGIRGMVIQLGKAFSEIRVEGEEVYAQSGATLARIAGKAYENSLTGLEFAAGIPGTLGGAVTMNAGAYGGEMKNVIARVEVLDQQGEIRVIPAEEMNFAYRHSRVAEEDLIVLSVWMKLEKGQKTDIKATMDELALARRTK